METRFFSWNYNSVPPGNFSIWSEDWFKIGKKEGEFLMKNRLDKLWSYYFSIWNVHWCIFSSDFFMEITFYKWSLQTADWEQKTKISNCILKTFLFINQSESTVLKFKCGGKFFVEAPKPQIESLKNQIGASKWFIWLYILRVLIAYDVLYFVKGPSP